MIELDRTTPRANLNALVADAAARLEAAGVEESRFEAQLLLAHALGIERLALLRGLDAPPDPAQLAVFERLVAERVRRVPLAYLRGWQEFYGLRFAVTPAVLVPRSETELLVELAIEALRGNPGATLGDVGTGSGCIAVAAAAHLPEARVVALDRSPNALAIARRNAEAHGVAGRVAFIQGDLLAPLAGRCADVIVSNPPYIPTDDLPALQPEVRDYEPRLALDGGPDGFAAHRRLLEDARRVLKPGGLLAFEVGMGQAPAVADLLRRAGFDAIETRRDLAGIERVVAGQWTRGRP